VITPEVGGGFGSKLNVYAEEALAATWRCAWQTGQVDRITPRKFSRLRFTAATRLTDVEVAFKRDGTILGCASCHRRSGCYYQLLTPLIPTLTD